MKPAIVLLLTFLLSGCATFTPIKGFPPEVNQKLEKFLEDSKTEPGRKIAVFDGDGTVLGQTPHYLADECMYMYAKDHHDKNPELLDKMKKMRNVAISYCQGRVEYLAGETLSDLRRMGQKCFDDLYYDKIFIPMRDLICQLKHHGFEVWVVTGSPQALYQQFLSKQLRIPITNVIGVKSVIRGGVVTDEIVPPVPQDHGKKEAIETFIQDRPLFVAGNSRGDKEMIEHSRGLRMIVNPDEHIAPDQKQSIADYAKEQGWLIVRIRDVPRPDFPSISSKDYGIRINKTRDVK
jgi:phosphoserine phosphatase